MRNPSTKTLAYFLKANSNHNVCNPSQVDYSLYMKSLQIYIERKAKKPGCVVHNQIITNGFASNPHLSTKLIIFYSRIGEMVSARKVLDRMPERSAVSWTAQISGYTKNGYYQDAFLVFSEMLRAGFKANQFTYGSVLCACTGLRCLKRGTQIQGCIVKSRFVDNLIVQSALVDLHSKCGKMEDASYLFGMMEKMDVVCWNAMIGGYAVQGYGDDSFGMFRSMMREGMIPDFFTFGSVLKASIMASGIIGVCQIHGLIIQLGYGSHVSLSGSLIDAYVKCGSLVSAYHIYRSMPTKDMISCTALMTGYARDGNYGRDALDLFKEFQQMNVKIDDVLICSMLNVCATIASLSVGKQFHALASKLKSTCDVAMGNALIDMYAKSGDIEDATRAFKEMEEKNVISWTSLITGYGNHGYGHAAIELFKKMEYEGLKPNDVSFLSLLFACNHCGLTGEGLECFNNMISKYNILPQADHFSCMVDLFARGGQLEEAYNMISKMNIKPDASIWGAILGACNMYGNISVAEEAAKHLFKLYPENSVNYVVLAGIYAAVGAWDGAWKVRKLMEERNLRKAPGYSFISYTKNIALPQPS